MVEKREFHMLYGLTLEDDTLLFCLSYAYLVISLKRILNIDLVEALVCVNISCSLVKT